MNQQILKETYQEIIAIKEQIGSLSNLNAKAALMWT